MPAHLPYDEEPVDAPVRFAMRFVVVMIAIPVVAVLLWLLLPDGPVSVAFLAIAVIAFVGGGIGVAMTRRSDLAKPPPRRPAAGPRGN